MARSFRAHNSELDVRPIRHHLANRVCAHMFLRMLTYYISRRMKQAVAPILLYDDDKPAVAAKRVDPVEPAQRSDAALAKAARERTDVKPEHVNRSGGNLRVSAQLVHQLVPASPRSQVR